MRRAGGNWVVMMALSCSCCLRQVSTFKAALGPPKSTAARSLHMSAQSMQKTASQGPSVCVIGAGFAGLASAYELASMPSVSKLCLIEKGAIGEAGASGASAGIMHPYSPKGKMAWRGLEAFAASERLLSIAEKAAGQSLTHCTGILRPFGDVLPGDKTFAAMKEKPEGEFLDWISADEYFALVPHGSPQVVGSARYKQGRVIDSSNYLRGLWKATQQQDMEVTRDDIAELAKQYSVVLAATGPYTHSLFPEMNLDFKLEGTRNMVFHNKYRLQHPLIAGQYVMPFGKDLEFLVCGSTKEYVKDQQALLAGKHDARQAIELLLEYLSPIYPAIVEERWEPLYYNFGVKALTRRTVNGRLPILQQHPAMPNVWVLAGFGSRGLLYHAYFAKELASRILQQLKQPSA